MKIRVLRPNEEYKAEVVSAVAFESGMDLLKEKAEQEAMTEEQVREKEAVTLPENPLPGDRFRRKIWAAMDDEERDVFAAVTVPVYTVRFDGSVSVMGGVGGVSTLPPYRRGGAIRAIMAAALADMNENGFDFSYLYPFSCAYYRKFGYESSDELREWEIQFKALKKYGVEGSVEMLLPGADFSVLTKLYNLFYSDYNLSVIRREYDEELPKKYSLNEKRYIYVWKNKAGEPRGYMIFTNGGGVLNCVCDFGNRGDFLALDAEAFMGLMDFAQTFAPNYHAIKFTAPSTFNFRPIIGEGNYIGATCFCNSMARVVNVERVLKKCRCRGSGTLTVGVTDPMAPWNEGVWKLSFGETNQVALTDDKPDIQLDINTFTLLICGFADFSDVSYMPQAKINNEKAPFSAVFYRKKSAVLDKF